MQVIHKTIKWFVLILSVFVILSFTNKSRKNQIANLNSLVIDYNKFIGNNNVIKYLTENNVSFDSVLISDINLVLIEEVLNKHPYIRRAEIYCDQAGNINILLKGVH